VATLRELLQKPSPYGAIMDLAGQLRPSDPNEAARLDRYAQGISTASMPGYTPIVDIPVNLALAAGYEGVKALPEAIGDQILEAVGYGRKSQGQRTSDASLANVLALYEGLKAGTQSQPMSLGALLGAAGVRR
jgi:hypothetical protein